MIGWLRKYQSWQWLLVAIVIQVPALRAFLKLPSHDLFVIPIFYTLVFGLYWHYFHTEKLANSLNNLLSQRWLFFTLMSLLIVVSYVGFHYELAIQARGFPAEYGSDFANAFVRAGLNFIHDFHPYTQITEYTNPISPGPGWVLLNLPFLGFGMNGLYFLLIPFWIGLAGLSVGGFGQHYFRSNLFLVILFSTMIFWEMVAVGIDEIAVGCAFVVCIYAIDSIAKRQLTGLKISLMIFAGAVATSRIPFFFLPALMGFLMMSRDEDQGWLFAIGGVLAMLVWHGVFYVTQYGAYPPFHSLHDADKITSPYLKLVIVAAVAAAGYWIIKHRSKELHNWLWITWLCLIVPLSFVSFAELSFAHPGQIRYWVGANYIAVTMPVLIAWLICRSTQDNPNKISFGEKGEKYASN